jgi:hypothetical protein
VDDAFGEIFLVLQVPCGRRGFDPASLVSP